MGVGVGTGVAHGEEPPPAWTALGVEAEEVSDARVKEPEALRLCVSTGRTPCSPGSEAGHRHRHENAVVRGAAEGLMGVGLPLLADPGRAVGLGEEVVAGIDRIDAVREEVGGATSDTFDYFDKYRA